MSGILLGLLTALCWGVADFLIKRVTAKIDPFVAPLATQTVGALALLPLFLLAPPSPPDGATIAGLLGAGLLGTAAFLLVFRAFAVGALAIVSPITGAYGAFTVVLAILFLEEEPRRGQLAGIALVLTGVVAVALQPKGRAHEVPGAVTGLWTAVGASVTLGLLFFVLGFVAPRTTPLVPAVAVRLVSIVLIGALLLARRHRPHIPPGAWRLLVPIGLLDVGGSLALNLGLDGAYVSIVSPLAACAGVVTVALATLVLRERPAPPQRAGIALVLGGVLALALR